MPRQPADKSVLERISVAITRYATRSGGQMPESVSVSPDEYRELLGHLVRLHGPAPLINPCVRGVPIKIDRGPYPWGSFPDG